MTRKPSPLRQFLEEFRPFTTGRTDSVFAERMRADQLTPDQIIHAYQTYRAMLGAPDPDALWKALDALCIGTAPYFDGLDAALKEADRLLDKERARLAVMPVPEEAFDGLNRNIKSDWTVKHYGERRLGAKYKDAAGAVLFCGVTFEREGEYSDHFYFYAEDGLWHEGVPMSSARPLYRLPEITDSALPVVIVVSGRAAAEDVPGYVVTTFAGGSSTCTDWAPLAERAVTIWPATVGDMRAAGAIKKRLPHARVLDSERAPWDVPADERAAYVATCAVLSMPGDDGAKLPFSFLGFDTGRYHFLPRRRRVPYTIDMGRFSSSQLLELAALGWWGMNNFVKDNGTLRLNEAQDWIVAEQEKVGMVDLRRLRGAGVWRDGEDIVVNDGAQIVTMSGERLEYDEWKSTACAEYIPSETRFGDMTGEESTDAEGEALARLFNSQRFARAIDPVLLLGWALIAPFGGMLEWRPMVWLTGKKGTGKSQVILKLLVDPLLGEFAYMSVGRKTTEAGIRRSINMTARPVRLDEMEAKSKKDQDRLSSVFNLPILAAHDTSSVVTMASGNDGTVTFIVRSPFLFASVHLPAEITEDSQAMSRFVVVEKKEVASVADEMARMSRECAPVMREPGRYRRRIFRALPRILRDIAAVHKMLLTFVGDSRECDVIAPLLAAAWAVQSAESVDTPEGRTWLAGLMDDFMRVHGERIEDEDRVIEHICSARVRLEGGREKAIAELLTDADTVTGEADARDILSRHGIRFEYYRNGDGSDHRAIAFAVPADPISHMLEDTPYSTGYDAQLKRNAMYRGDKKARFKIGVKKCRLLDWGEFKSRYLGFEQGKLEGIE